MKEKINLIIKLKQNAKNKVQRNVQIAVPNKNRTFSGNKQI